MTTAEVAQVEYTLQQIRLDDMAREVALAGRALMAARIRHAAAIAYRAAKAERIPEGLPIECAKCHVCGGTEACDIPAHLLRTTFISRTDR